MKEYDLKPLWNDILEIYNEFSRICVKYHLKHFVAYGSAIGAVRHHGFIPWDDDFDVIMPRHDYDRFMEIAIKELPEYYKVVSFRNEPIYGNVFNLIRDERIDRREKIRNLTGLSSLRSVYMDIFPIDGFPYKGLSFWLFRVKTYLLNCLENRLRSCEYRSGRVGTWRSFVGCIASVLFRRIRSVSDLMEYRDSWARSNKYEECEFVAYLTEYRSVWRREWFNESQQFVFEGRLVPLPKDYDAWLRCSYGDYRKLPPEEQRHPSHQ